MLVIGALRTGDDVGMTMRASIHLPPAASSGYVRVELDGDTVGFLKRDFYDVVCRTDEEFAATMKVPGAEEESHSTGDRRVVRLRGHHALAILHAHLSHRPTD
jgi:hypothetical protein